jgi:hypothetical protein
MSQDVAVVAASFGTQCVCAQVYVAAMNEAHNGVRSGDEIVLTEARAMSAFMCMCVGSANDDAPM